MATVTSTFLSAVAACTWSDARGGTLVSATAGNLWPHAIGSDAHTNPWGLAVPGSANAYAIPHPVYASLIGATANTDGSFTTSGGVIQWLGLNAAGTAVADLPSGPPPP